MIDKTSVIIVNTNQKDYIENCLQSLELLLLNSHFEIIIVDNNSSDGTPEFVEKNYPKVRLIKTKNRGFCAANNLGVKNADGEFIVLLNPDTKVSEGSLEKLVSNLKDKDNTVTVPKILLYEGHEINTVGNVNHFTGFSFTKGLGESWENYNKQEYIKALSGACFCIRKQDYLKLGGLDETFFLYMDDADFSWNLKCNGYNILYVPDSVIYHDYEFRLSGEKINFVEKGRYIILRKYLTWKQLLMFLPAFLLTEILTFGYSALKGKDGIKHKLNAIKEGFNTQVEHRECDRRLLFNSLDYKIPENPDLIPSTINKISNLIYSINYVIIMRLWNLQ